MRSTRRPDPRSGPRRTPPGSRGLEAATRDGLGSPGGVPWSWSVALAAALLGSYLLLAPHVSGDKDASEFALVLATGGALHPTGYPLFTLLGHASVALLHRAGAGFPFAANAWAACGGGVAMLLFHRLALRLLPARDDLSRRERFLLAALPVVVLGFNPVWMVESTVVEVHSWQLAWGCGTALFAAGLIDALGGGGRRLTRLPLRMVAWGLLCGLGGAHHFTAVFLAGGMTLALGWSLAKARLFRAWVPLVWLAAGVVPLLSYGYVAYRAVHPGGGEVWPMLEPGLGGFLAHVTARAYRAYLGHWAPDETQLAWLLRYVYPLLWPGLALFGFQWWRSRGARRRLMTGLLVAAGAQVVFVHHYGVPDPNPYLLPPLAVAGLSLVRPGADLAARLRRTRFGVALATTVAAVALALFVVSGATLMAGRSREFVRLDEQYHAMWESIPHERAIVLWPADGIARLREYQVFRGEKRGIDLYNTAALVGRAQRSGFRKQYGFDPLALVDRPHLAEPLRQEFVIGRQTSPMDAHGFTLIHQCIAERAGIPVVAFDPPAPPRTLPAKPADPAPPAAPR